MSFIFRGRRPKMTDAPIDIDPGAVVTGSTSRFESIEFVSADDSLLASMHFGTERVSDLLNRDALVTPIDVVLLVVPPARPADPQRRLHRPRRAIEVEVGPFEVAGNMHVPPGAQAAGFLARVNPRFVPVTHAVIRRSDSGPGQRHADVVLVNVSHMRHFTEGDSALVADVPSETVESS